MLRRQPRFLSRRRFAGALSLNVLDCVHSPLGHLVELGRTLAPGAPALLCTPYDWSPAATAAAAWIGGHSQRGEAGGSSEAELRRILSADAAAGVDTGLVIAAERDRVPWRVYANERSATEYAVHLLRLERRGSPVSRCGRPRLRGRPRPPRRRRAPRTAAGAAP